MNLFIGIFSVPDTFDTVISLNANGLSSRKARSPGHETRKWALNMIMSLSPKKERFNSGMVDRGSPTCMSHIIGEGK